MAIGNRLLCFRTKISKVIFCVVIMTGLTIIVRTRLVGHNTLPGNEWSVIVTNKPFLYLIQTEKCLREKMTPVNAMGNSSVCDILVLSFKELCNDTSLPHVTYMFDNTVTWTAGRTLLYYAAKNLSSKYLYYIYVDDDVLLDWVDTSRVTTKLSPWRAFEQFLIDVEPPLAATDNTDWRLLSKVYKKRYRDKCKNNGTDPLYFVALWFDATVNAFHQNAIEHLFEPIQPYWTRFDNISWWFPQWYVNIMADIVYHRQTLFYSRVIAINLEHRMYPRKTQDFKVINQIAEDIKSVLPPKYHKATQPIFEKWIQTFQEGQDILKTVRDTYCYPIPAPKRRFVPYEHLQIV